MYTKEQKEIVLREYEWLSSVHGVIQRLGYPGKSILYRWYKRSNAGLENRHSHTEEDRKKTDLSSLKVERSVFIFDIMCQLFVRIVANERIYMIIYVLPRG